MSKLYDAQFGEVLQLEPQVEVENSASLAQATMW